MPQLCSYNRERTPCLGKCWNKALSYVQSTSLLGEGGGERVRSTLCNEGGFTRQGYLFQNGSRIQKGRDFMSQSIEKGRGNCHSDNVTGPFKLL